MQREELQDEKSYSCLSNTFTFSQEHQDIIHHEALLYYWEYLC